MEYVYVSRKEELELCGRSTPHFLRALWALLFIGKEHMKKVKQISYLTAIIISIGSTVGAGIFFKNGSIFSNVDGSLWLMITSWLVAGIGVLALGLALVEMSSASKKDGGILEWARKFLPKRLSKVSASYMLLIYLPLNYLAMPLYVVNTLQDAIQSIDPDIKMNGGVVAAISMGIFLFTATLDWVKHKASESMQIVISWSKFIPLILVAVFALYATTQTGVQTSIALDAADKPTSITAYSPYLGVIASIPAILFAYDGFYAITSLKSDMKEPKKLGSVVALGISLITALYVAFGVITGMTGKKNLFGFMGQEEFKYALCIANIFIAIAVFAIVNSFAMITYRMYDDVYEQQPTGIVGFFKKLLKIQDAKLAAWLSSVIITILMYIVLIPVGILGFSVGAYGTGYGDGAGNLYNLADMLTNYTSLMVFLIINGAVIGAIINRKTGVIPVTKKWYFIPAAIVATTFSLIGSVYMVIDNIAGMTGLNGADAKTEITKFVILSISILGTVAIAFGPEIKNVSIKFGKLISKPFSRAR